MVKVIYILMEYLFLLLNFRIRGMSIFLKEMNMNRVQLCRLYVNMMPFLSEKEIWFSLNYLPLIMSYFDTRLLEKKDFANT